MIDMTLGQKQRRFTRMIAQLIEYAYTNGTSWATAKTWSGVTGWVAKELKAFEL